MPEIGEQALAIMVEEVPPARAGPVLSAEQARWVFCYYIAVQRQRLRAQQQAQHQPDMILTAIVQEHLDYLRASEERARRQLHDFVSRHPVGSWLLTERGIGSLLAAALIAYLDVAKAKNYRSFWQYAGLTPGAIYRRGHVNGWNRQLRRVCYLLGECLMRARNHEASTYGKLYDCYKQAEVEHNERGDFAAQAAQVLAAKHIRADRPTALAYREGRLPPAHLHARARRRMVKDLLADIYVALYFRHKRMMPRSRHRSPYLEPLEQRKPALFRLLSVS